MATQLSNKSQIKAKTGGPLQILQGLNMGDGANLLAKFTAEASVANRQALATHFSLCAQIVARRVYQTLTNEAKRQIELCDVEQIAQCRLYVLVERYDASHNVPMTAFLMTRLPLGVIDELRSMNICTRKDRLDASAPKITTLKVNGDESDTVQVASVEISPARKLENRQFRKSALRSLPKHCRLYIAHRYFRNLTVTEAARKAGLGIQKAYAIQKEAVPHLMAFIEQRPVSLQSPRTRPAARSVTLKLEPVVGFERKAA